MPGKQVDEARVAAAIKGALLADAASMGAENYPNPEELGDTPEFKDPPAAVGFSAADYPGHYGPGQLSPWGEQLLFAIEYVGKEKLVAAGPMSVALMKWAEDFGGYQDSGISEFMTCMKAGDRSVELCGKEDERAAAFARIIPTICLYAGELDMVERVKETVMIYQTNPKAIRFCCAAASLLEAILLGKSLKLALEKVVNNAMSSSSNFSLDDSDIGDACLYALMEAKMKDLPQLMEGLEEEEDQGGKTALFPAAFIVPMYLFYKSMADGEATEESYIKAVRSNIKAGGDVCLRAIFLGAVFAAAAGSVPKSFEEKVSKETMETVDKSIQEICSVLN
eukprot:Nitzschia sp. Nitz4//scaffold23_size168460//146286//147393//NITZ4_002246-RA/size168460-snap-gene-0.129-mRNA-1//1//CDS//3329543716//3516//frame0